MSPNLIGPTWFLGRTRVDTPYGVWIRSSVLVGLTVMTGSDAATQSIWRLAAAASSLPATWALIGFRELRAERPFGTARSLARLSLR